MLSIFSNSTQNIGFLFGQILACKKHIYNSYLFICAFHGFISMTVGAFLLLGIMSTILKAYFGKKLKYSQKTIESLEVFNGALVESIKNVKFIKTRVDGLSLKIACIRILIAFKKSCQKK